MDPLQRGVKPVAGIAEAGAQRAAQAPHDPRAGAVFKALLERLEGETRRLGEASDGVHGVQDLAGAVDVARASVEEAIQLGDELLEAYRAARQRAETGSSEGT